MKTRVYSHWCKAFLVLSLIIIGCFGSGLTTVHADSPLTSTAIYKAYLDVDMVAEAEKSGLNKNVADFLKSPGSPLDEKAAAVNALYSDQVWSDRDMAEAYSLLAYGKNTGALDKKELAAEEIFVIGYMKILDNYMEPDLSWISEAKMQLPDSLTAALIHMLGVSQLNMDCSWNYTEGVLTDTGLKEDIRPEAVDIITEYMKLYKGSPCQADSQDSLAADSRINNILQNSILLSVGHSDVIVKGTKAQLDSANAKVVPYIRDGKTMVPLRFLSDMFGVGIRINPATHEITIEYNKLKIVMSERTKEMEIRSGRTFIPLRTVMDMFDKQIYYSRGLIIISDNLILDPRDPQDQQMTEQIRIQLEL